MAEYVIKDDVKKDILEVYRYVESNYNDFIRNVAMLNGFTLKSYSLRFVSKASVKVLDVKIIGNYFYVEELKDGVSVGNHKYRLLFDEAIGRAWLKSCGADDTEDLEELEYFIFACPILTMLRSKFSVDRKGRHYIREGRVHSENKVYSIIDLRVPVKYNREDKIIKHSYEYEVKGYWRTTKLGKKVWVKPSVRCKGKGKNENMIIKEGVN